MSTASQTSKLTIEELKTLGIASKERVETKELIPYFEITKRHAEVYDAVMKKGVRIDSFSQSEEWIMLDFENGILVKVKF